MRDIHVFMGNLNIDMYMRTSDGTFHDIISGEYSSGIYLVWKSKSYRTSLQLY